MSLRRRGPESEITSTRTAATNLEDHDELDLGVTKLDTSGMYDVHQVKRLLDDVVVPLIESKGYVEATTLSTVRILSGIVAISAALYSQFSGHEYPESRSLVFLCVGIYISCLALVAVLSWAMEGDSFYVGYLSSQASKGRKKKSSIQGLPSRIFVQSSLAEQGTSTYSLKLRDTVRSTKNGQVVLEKAYEKYFYEDGELVVDELRKDVYGLLRELANKAKTS